MIALLDVNVLISLMDEDQGAKQLTDIYLLALAVKHGGRLVTRDGNIPLHAVHGAKLEHLLVL